MSQFNGLKGVYAAAVTPLKGEDRIDLDSLPGLLDFFARRGCHGALLLGTTGEGPSFAFNERLEIFKASLSVRQVHPQFRMLAGTGTPSLEETISLTKAAFDIGMDGVVVLPPYYYRNASDEGLYRWFSRVIQSAVPAGGAVFGYHIPPVSGVPLSLELLARLKESFPDRFAGIKDSSSDPERARQTGLRFGDDLVVFNGNDSLLTQALQSHAVGCITAMANLFSPISRQVYDTFQDGEPDRNAQSHLDACRAVMNRYPPAPPLLKALLRRLHNFPDWPVRPPLIPLPEGPVIDAINALAEIAPLV